MENRIGIKPENLAAGAHKLAVMLADEFLLYTKTRNAHWNVEGVIFTPGINSSKNSTSNWTKLWMI
ncbi:MAG TPA: hypothetical protein VEY06_11940 [Flavisolibacter sp.]|nr:hypothetical protein [Flavisolibacter sp.]